MPDKSKKRQLTPSQIKEQIKRIREMIEKQKLESKCEQFIALTPVEIEKKLKRVNSPMIISVGYNSSVSAGGTIPIFLGIGNPDPNVAQHLCANVWVGTGNIDPIIGTSFVNVDTRFPRLVQPGQRPGTGLDLAAHASAYLLYSMQVPIGVDKTTYLVNICLMQLGLLDVGNYLDRACFLLTVS